MSSSAAASRCTRTARYGPSAAELEKLVRDLPGLIVRNRTPVDEALLELAPKLKVVGRLGVGLDNIDVAACEARGIEVCSARGANATSVSEYAIAMAMILLRGRAYLDTHRLVAGEWPREELGRGVELAGKTLGVIGLGSIGSTSARKARALEMRVIACDPYLPDDSENWNVAAEGVARRAAGQSRRRHHPLPAQSGNARPDRRGRDAAHEEGRRPHQLGPRRHRRRAGLRRRAEERASGRRRARRVRRRADQGRGRQAVRRHPQRHPDAAHLGRHLGGQPPRQLHDGRQRRARSEEEPDEHDHHRHRPSWRR